LATVQALATNRNAVTFNSAGVNRDTFQRLNISETNIANADQLINAYHVDGEILTALQTSNALDNFVAIKLTGIKNGYEFLRGITDPNYEPNYGVPYVPEAQGRSIELPAVNENGSLISEFGQLNPITSGTLHTRGPIQRGIDHLLSDYKQRLGK
jgi:hypothetical protein